MTGRIRPGGRLRLSVTVFMAGLLLSGCASLPGDKASQEDSSAEATAAYTRLGEAYLTRNNLPRAMTSLNRALEIDPHNTRALQALALVYSRQGNLSLADKTYRQALAADPEMTRARNNYAVFLYEQGRVAEACSEFKQASGDSRYAHRAQLLDNLDQCQRRLENRNAVRPQDASSG
ncbi:MAG: tetratricopeptide repeat protein [Halomonas sp.]|uniref:tetratricopeptide repeat protein n=1 Tax=Halomonas sp. TaxID=1486246 RepID=UPI003F8E5A73